MWTHRIEQILSADGVTRTVFGGVFPSDRLPDRVAPGKRLFVANTDPEAQPGRHWVAMYFGPDGVCSYFDSHGQPPLLDSFIQFIKRNAEDWTSAERRFQHAKSNVCGHYCIYFARRICQGVSMDKIVNVFDPDQRMNDLMMVDYVQHHYGRLMNEPHYSGQTGQCCTAIMSV